MLVDALGDERVGDLQQQGARPGAEEQGRLAVESPGLGAGAVEPGAFGIEAARRPGDLVARRSRRQRSLGRWPTTHQAAGNTAAAASSFTVSTGMNGSMPSLIASPSDIPVVAASHGTPTA